MCRSALASLVVLSACQLPSNAVYACAEGDRCPQGFTCRAGLCEPNVAEDAGSAGGEAGGGAVGGGGAAGGTAGGGAAAGGGAGGGSACSPATVRCTEDLDCGYFDAGCGVSVFCGRCDTPLECGVAMPNRCDEPRVCTPEGWCWEHPLPQGADLVSGFALGPRAVWLGTSSGSLLFWNGERTEGTRFPTQAGIGIRAIFAGSSSDLFVGAEGGRIFWFDGSTWTREVISTNPPNAILSIHRGLTGPPVAAGSGGVLLRRSLDAGVWTPIALSPAASPSFRRVFVAEPFVLAMTEGGAVYRGPVGSSQLSLLASAPASPLGEVQAGAFSGDGGLAFLAASVAASVRVLVLDLRESTPVWRPFASYSSLAAVSALEVDGDRVLVAGNTGNVAVLTLDGDGGAEVSRVLVDPSDSFRSVVVLGGEEVLLGGTGGVMGFLGRDGGAWQLTSSDFSGNRRETLNDGCAVTASVAGSPVVHVTTNNNGVGTRSTRWGWVTGGLAQNGFDWTACHLTDPQRAWVIGNNRRQSGARFSRMLTRRGSAWVDADPGISSEDWASVTGLPDGTTYFLVNGSVVVINRDGGTAPEAFEAVALDGGPVHGLVALEQGRAAALQGAADAGIVWESNAGVTQWTWRVTNRPAPNELLAIHGEASSGEARTLAVGAGGFFVENQSTGRVSGRLGSTDLTDVWVSRSLTAYIATAVDGGTSVGRTSPLVIIRASDGGARTEPVPVSQRIRGLFGVDDLDDVTRVWVTGSGGAILRRDFLPDGG